MHGLEPFLELGEKAFAAREEARRGVPQVVVSPAVPILYFGDLEAYLDSPSRVVTVGLNPSRKEFPEDEPFQRFPGALGLRDGQTERYLGSLNDYYRIAPYRAWFSTFEHLLRGMAASYYPGARSTALHTDLCSPVATDPTWSQLNRGVRQALIASGRPLWHELVRRLRPDVVLISVARFHLSSIEFPAVTATRELYRIERAKPYIAQSWEIGVDDDHRTMVVFGQAAHTPFGTVGRKDKEAIGRKIEEVLHGR